MPASEKSFLGIAKQSVAGSPIALPTSGSGADAFDYLLFTDGSVSPNNIVLPLDQEVGGGSLLRDMVKVGVSSGGALDFIPRPKTLGHMLYGITGKVASTGDTAKTHVFTIDSSDEFSLPYYTIVTAPGQMWGEVFQDVRIQALGLQFRAANFLRGTVALLGGLPKKDANYQYSKYASQIDAGPQFLAPVCTVELPLSTPVSVLSGSFAAGISVPLEEQFVVGSYSPQGLDVNGRSYAITLNIKISDGSLYSKMMYDPAAGSTWVASMMKEGSFKLDFKTAQDITGVTGTKYELKIEGNGHSDSDANVVWSASPIAIRAGRQVVLSVSGTFLANKASGHEPITITLVNDKASY